MQSSNIFDIGNKLPLDNFYITKLDILPSSSGILDNLTFAVKDVIDIQNYKTSCGNPTWMSSHEEAKENAICIDKLLAAGARCIGKTVLGEFCSGTTGVNHYYGMPPNPNAPERVPGGSSSGSASIVASKAADFSIGTDVAGSVRIPASFCGIYGFKTSYGILSMNGVKSFSPSYDSLGIFSNSIEIIDRVFGVLAGADKESFPETPKNLYLINDLMVLIPTEQRLQIEEFIKSYCAAINLSPIFINLFDIHPSAGDKDIGVSSIFRKLFCSEIWKSLGGWIDLVKLEFNRSTFVDFSYMKMISKENLLEEHKLEQLYFNALNQILQPGNLICIPTAPDVAPLRNKEFKKVNEFNYEKLRPLISLASIGKLPQINIPIKASGFPPIGISFLAGHKQDYFLINVIKKMVNDLERNKRPSSSP